MYTLRNFKTKKALKEAVKEYVLYKELNGPTPARHAVEYYQPGPFGGNEPREGWFSVEGPHYPEVHRWYARCRAQDGVIVEVK